VAFLANVLKVMIASPGDVVQERGVVTQEIHRWNDANAPARQLVLLPVKWETHSTPQLGAHPQSIINHQLLDDADIVVGIFGTRIGTPTEEHVSGTVEEIKKHVAAGKTAKVYFSDVPVPPSAVDASQYALVQRFREECRSAGLYATFESIEEFRSDFAHHLDLEMNQLRYRWLAVPDSAANRGVAEHSKDALRLLRAAATQDGTIISQETLDSQGIRAGDEEFADGTARTSARWRAALKELDLSGAIEQISAGIYRLTAAGYEIADRASAQPQNSEHNVSPFEEHQTSHVRALIAPLPYTQRDLLRLLLLQGGEARIDVVYRAAVSQTGLDVGTFSRPLVESGLIARTDDTLLGQSTLMVNGQMAGALRELLFPRKEGKDAPFFKGV
jgi:hypothetical protein